jgi:hypothetical protein
MIEFCKMVLRDTVKTLYFSAMLLLLGACGSSTDPLSITKQQVEMPVDMQFGFNMIDFEVELDTIRSEKNSTGKTIPHFKKL